MKFEDAIQRSIKDFLKGNSASKTAETAEGGLYYTPEFFDEFEEKFLEATKGLKVTKKSKSKSKKGEDKNEV